MVWINDLKLLKKAAKIIVYTVGNVPIPHLSSASMAFTSDFGTVDPTDPHPTSTFRVRNFQGTSGSTLNVNSIVVEGSHPDDFLVAPTSLNNIANVTTITNDSNNFKAFTVTFNPQGDGVRTAEIKLYSNSAPSPYVFTVVGIGASCSLESKAHVINTSGVGGINILTLNADYLSSDLIGGTATPANSNTLNTVLYPSGSLYMTANQSLFARNTEKTFAFGGAGGVDISELKEVSIEFNLAAFTTTDGWWGNTNSDNGVGPDSYMRLEVFKDGVWSKEMMLKGGNSPLGPRYYRYDFNSGSVFNAAYDGNNSAVEVENTGSTK